MVHVNVYIHNCACALAETLVVIPIYIAHPSSYFLHVVHSSVSRYGIFDNCACVLGEKLISRLIVKSHYSSHVMFRTCWCLLAQNRCHLRMRICCANEIVPFSCLVLLNPIYFHLSICLFITSNSQLQTTGV